MNSNNLDIKFRARKLGIPETAIAKYFHKSYSWLLQNLRHELPKADKMKFIKAIDAINADNQKQSKEDAK